MPVLLLWGCFILLMRLFNLCGFIMLVAPSMVCIDLFIVGNFCFIFLSNSSASIENGIVGLDIRGHVAAADVVVLFLLLESWKATNIQ